MTALDPSPVPVQPITKAALEAAFAKIVGTGPGAAEQAFLAQAHEDYAADETPELGGDDPEQSDKGHDAAHEWRFLMGSGRRTRESGGWFRSVKFE